MDYVDWVHKVMRAALNLWQRMAYDEKLLGFSPFDIVPELGFDNDPRAAEFRGSSLFWAIHNAIDDLERIGWLEDEANYCKVTRMGEAFSEGDVPSAWRRVMDIELQDEEAAVLQVSARLGQEVFDDHVHLRESPWQTLFQALGWPEDSSRAALLTRGLRDLGLMMISERLGGTIDTTPNYVGIVRATREAESEDAALIRQLADEWETTNVEFKRQLNLNSNVEKAKFVSRIMGLATTRASGRRFLVIGFDDKTREFSTAIDPGITQERLEQIMHNHCQPPPKIKVKAVPFGSGSVGLIEVFREPTEVPYEVMKALGGREGIKAGEVFVRHGSRTEHPTPAELQDLLNERKSARS